MSNTPQADFFISPDLIARSLESLMEQCHDEIDRLGRQPHQGSPDIKEETKFYLRQYRAFTKALHYWLRGIRPTPTPAGGWLIPSASKAGAVVHEVEQHGSVWMCGPSCEGRHDFHWHTALVSGIEHAIHLADAEDDGEIESYDEYEEFEPVYDIHDDPRLPSAAAILGRRLAEARARLAA